ncbi:phosphate transport system permease protein [Streptacidiphilus sp. MAP12-20]|uniref:phosphate ABC transporter permease PstA n=1 Tax=Streptacidiphilus sp. MAP12-20 TaxID=3156299 RepID=UPI003518CBDE
MTVMLDKPDTWAPQEPAPPQPATTVVVRAATADAAASADAAAEPVRRRLGGRARQEGLALAGAAAAAPSLTSLLFGQLAPFSGGIGFAVTGYVVFLATYALLVWLEESGPAVRDRLATVALASAATLLFGTLVLVLVFTALKGWHALPHWNFYSQDMQAAGPLDPISVGGILHAVAGTLIQISIALTVTVPLGITCAVYLGQVRGRFTRFVRTIVEAMTALPSVVAGLFVYATWILILHFQKSGLAAGLAISVMMLPIVIRAADVVLRLVPGNLTEAAEALGAPRWRTVWHVILPSSRSGLATAVILGTARGIGETSPVLLTAGTGAALNLDPTNGPMMSLPLAVFTFIKSPQPAMVERAFGTALALMALVVLLFALARAIGGRGPGQLTERQLRRADRASRRDLARFRTGLAAPAAPTPAVAALAAPAPAAPVAPGATAPNPHHSSEPEGA